MVLFWNPIHPQPVYPVLGGRSRMSVVSSNKISNYLPIRNGAAPDYTLGKPLVPPWSSPHWRVDDEKELVTMDEKAFQAKLTELMGEISTLPKTERDKLQKVADQTKERHQKLKKTVSDLQESLDYLRLSIKYMVFDLEATRRENRYLRKMLEEDTSGRDDDTYNG